MLIILVVKMQEPIVLESLKLGKTTAVGAIIRTGAKREIHVDGITGALSVAVEIMVLPTVINVMQKRTMAKKPLNLQQNPKQTEISRDS